MPCALDPFRLCDESILQKTSPVERTRFEKLALEHMDSMYRVALRLARHPDDAGDLVQDAYVKAFRVADRYEEKGGGIRPWLLKILHNVFYTKITKDKRRPVAMETLPDAVSTEPAPDEPALDGDIASFDWEHVDERLKEAVEELRPEYASVLLLWAVEGMKYREIAEIQDIPLGTVMSRLHRARSILTKELSDLGEEIGQGKG